jgi:hypothetical protein
MHDCTNERKAFWASTSTPVSVSTLPENLARERTMGECFCLQAGIHKTVNQYQLK